MYINGAWLHKEKKIEVYNPANGELIKSVSEGDALDSENAIKSAEKAFEHWSELPGSERSIYLEKIANKILEKKETLARTITLEMGKAITNARYEVESTASFFKWFAGEARRVYGETLPSIKRNKRLMEIKHPVGVVAAITPWNFPLSMGARKLAPALAAGCTVILRPSNSSPISAIELFKIFEECSLPKGVANLVVGPAETIVNPILESSVVRKISFTGSTEVGKLLMSKSADTMKRVSMELGGHAPYIVFEDADLDEAVEGAITIKFGSTGQQCTSVNRFYVHESIYDEFIKRYKVKISELKVDNGIIDSCQVGPLINESAIIKVEEHVEDALNHGATLEIGGTRLNNGKYEKGYFYQPTLLTNVDERMKISYEETFGPVAPVFSFKDQDEVIQKANSTNFGLAAYFFTKDLTRTYEVMEKLDFGMVGVNDPYPFATEGSFGGVKESGVGREGGHGIEEYLEKKFISIVI